MTIDGTESPVRSLLSRCLGGSVRANRKCWLAGVAILGGWLCLPSCGGSTHIVRRGDTLDVSKYPEDVQAAYKVFAVRCSRCHTLARPLNARINDPQHWVRYVQRMRLNPASGINAKNGETILRFLLYYMHQRELERRAKNPEPDAEDAPAADAVSSTGPDAEPAPDAVEPQPPAAEAAPVAPVAPVAPTPAAPAPAPEVNP